MDNKKYVGVIELDNENYDYFTVVEENGKYVGGWVTNTGFIPATESYDTIEEVHEELNNKGDL